MITPESHQLGLTTQRRDSLMPAQLLKSLGHLLPGNIVVHGCDRDIPTIDDFGPILIRVNASPGIEASERCLSGRGLADGARTKASSGSVGDGCIKGSTDNSNVESLGRICKAFDVVEMGKCANAGETPLPFVSSQFQIS